MNVMYAPAIAEVIEKIRSRQPITDTRPTESVEC